VPSGSSRPLSFRRVWRVVSPEADLEVDEHLVRSMLAEQHPDLAGLSILRLDAGWDNTLWRVGDELLARLPRRTVAAGLTTNEQRWLPTVGPLLPLPVPVPIRVGRPALGYPWSWSILPWLDGTPGDRTAMISADGVAKQLGSFLRALHRPAPSDAPGNPYRGVPLVERRSAFEERLSELDPEIDAASVRLVWERACDAPPWAGRPTWLHGDLHPANILFADGVISAVVDFGDICAGDPATDIAAAWMLLPASAMQDFSQSYGDIDADLEARTLGWAVLFGLMLLAIGLDDKPTYEPIGRRTLNQVISHGRQTRDQRRTE
jgi:aminoglycoside phosphotransferase (APT) family kinase protein